MRVRLRSPGLDATGVTVGALQLVVSGAGAVSMTALPLLVIASQGPAAVGLSLACVTIGRLGAVQVLGWLGDRWTPVTLLRLALSAAVAGIASTVLGADVSVGWVCLGAFLGGISSAVYFPAVRLLLAHRVRPHEMSRVLGNLTAIDNATALVGPVVAALLISVASARLAVAVTGVGYALGFLLVLKGRQWRGRRSPSPEGGRRPRAREVWRQVRGHPWVVAGAAQTFVQVVLGFAPSFVLMRTVVVEQQGENALVFSLIAAAAGGICGGVVAGRWRPQRPGLVANLGFVTYSTVGICLATGAPYLLLASTLALGTAMTTFHGVWWYVALVRAFPEEIRGRLFALDLTVTGLAESLATAVTVPLVRAFGTVAIGATVAAVFVVAPFCTLLVPGFTTYGARPPA